MGIMPSIGNTYFVFHEFMYSALPTKLMLRGTLSMRNAESRKEMWFGHRIAGPPSGKRSNPAVSIDHSRRGHRRNNLAISLLRLSSSLCVDPEAMLGAM